MVDMFCQNCGTELRKGSRFCRSCGEPVGNRPKRSSANPRLTVALPREQPPLRHADSQSNSKPVEREKEDSLILPILDKPSETKQNQEQQPDSEIVRLSPPASVELPQLIQTSRVKRQLKEKVAPPITALTRRTSEIKPLLEQVLGADPEIQQRRLIAIVPLLLLVVILLFVFAYFAAK
jgi:hypothetical protein